ncbi:flagellar basal-body rod protein FlgG [Candidatus Poribacteria bacterium]|nr:flagellar basal-body rod protein FlgG [Candidatus Poribacteria bacterium]
MMRALWSSASGMIAQQKHIDVISNNIANVNTVGFKGSRADFQDLVYQVIRPAGAINLAGAQIPTGIEIGHGTQLVATPTRFAQGDFKETEDSLDLAIQGEGFFRIQLPDGRKAYTRAGAFSRDSQGNLVTADGLLLDPPVQIPSQATETLITADGAVLVKYPGEIEFTQQGSIQLALFPNPRGLQHAGRGMYIPSEAAGDEILGAPGQNGMGTIQSGMLEMSNVKIVDEMVGLIIAQRAYEANSKSIQTADEMLSMANNLRR